VVFDFWFYDMEWRFGFVAMGVSMLGMRGSDGCFSYAVMEI